MPITAISHVFFKGIEKAATYVFLSIAVADLNAHIRAAVIIPVVITEVRPFLDGITSFFEGLESLDGKDSDDKIRTPNRPATWLTLTRLTAYVMTLPLQMRGSHSQTLSDSTLHNSSNSSTHLLKMGNKEIPNIITRPLPNGVTYNLSTPGRVHITLPTSSTWTSGLHWHETHTEYLCLTKGSIWVQLDDKRDVFTVKDGETAEVEVPPYTWHEWGRASLDGEDVEVVERTDPEDGDKAVFFWNLNGVILDAPKMLTNVWLARLPARLQGLFLDMWIPLNLFVIFRYLDNVPVFLNAQKLLSVSNVNTKTRLKSVDIAVSHFVLWVASWAGWMIGLEPVQTRYTPDVEYAEWHMRQRK